MNGDEERPRAPEHGETLASAGGLPAVTTALRHAVRAGLGRALPALALVNQREGFDCPGCAWPEAATRSFVEFCENGAKAVAHEATSRRAGRDFFARTPVAELRARDGRWLEAQGRLVEPMRLRRGGTHFEPIGWDEAFAHARRALRALDAPDRAVFYTSGRTSNEAAFLWQLFVRRFGTNNLPDCSNMCHESSGTGLSEMIGVGKGTVSLEDFELADLIFVIGQNPGTNHPRMLDDARAGGAARRAHRERQPAARSGPRALRAPAAPAAIAAAAGRPSPSASCRCGSAATWRSSRAS